jgi:hypothetical protein
LFALKTLTESCGVVKWQSEKSFATDGYGGKVDLHTDEFLIDIKTTEKDLGNIKTWDEHAQQLSAYDSGLGIKQQLSDFRQCGILYINVTDASSRLLWIDERELQRGWKCFNALLDYWYAKNGMEVQDE